MLSREYWVGQVIHNHKGFIDTNFENYFGELGELLKVSSHWTSRLRTRACPLCGGDDFHVISHEMQHTLDLDTVICKSCSYVFTNPIPEKSIYESFYTEAYAGYYGHLSPRSPHGQQGLVSESLNQKLNWISEIDSFKGKRLLEVGPGQGSFLSLAQRKGADVLGIEPSPEFYKVLQEDNIPCVCGSLDQFSPEIIGHFDIVVMFHVLEHFYDPNTAMDQVWELLNDDGLFILEVPNILKPFRSLDRFYLRYVHPSSFSPQTLDAFIAKHKFSTVFANEGGINWRVPNSLFIIAKKEKHASPMPPVPQDWKNVALLLKKYQHTWIYWGQFRWMFFNLYLVILRSAIRNGRRVKRLFSGDKD